MKPDPGMEGERRRNIYRRLVRERGPDTGRFIERLSYRGADGGAEAVMAAYERGGIAIGQVTELSDRTNGVLFMVGVSVVGGTDTVG